MVIYFHSLVHGFLQRCNNNIYLLCCWKRCTQSPVDDNNLGCTLSIRFPLETGLIWSPFFWVMVLVGCIDLKRSSREKRGSSCLIYAHGPHLPARMVSIGRWKCLWQRNAYKRECMGISESKSNTECLFPIVERGEFGNSWPSIIYSHHVR